MSRSYSYVGRNRHLCVIECRAVIEFCGLTLGLRVSLWRFRRNSEGTQGTARQFGMRNSELGYGAVLHSKVHFYAIALTLPCFPRGVRWGLRAPKPAPRRPVSLDSLHLIRGHVRFTQGGDCAFYAGTDRFRTIGDLTGFNKWRPHCGWPGKSCDTRRQQVELAQPA